MSTVMKSIWVVALLGASSEFAPLAAQTGVAGTSTSQSSEDESRQALPEFATGVAVGTMRFSSGRTEAAISATLQYSPNEWLTFSAT